MTIDDDIRRALDVEADRYDPADDGWDRIATGVGAVRRRRRAVGGGLAGVAAVAVVAAIGLGGSLGGGGGTDVDASGEPSVVASDPATPTTGGPDTTVTAPSDPADEAVFPGIWPFASQAAIDAYADGDASLEDPVATATAFARDYLGMADPAVGPARDAGGVDGDVLVDVSPRGEDGAPLDPGVARTTVQLRPYGTTAGEPVWTVVDARSPHIEVDAPVARAEATSPLAVRGRATGYEGTVVAEVRADGMRAGRSLGGAVGIAGTLGELAPLALDVAFDPPATATGALVLTTDSGLGGGPFEATVVRLAFGPPDGPAATTTSTSTRPAAAATPCPPPVPTGDAAADEVEVTVHLVCTEAAGADAADEATWVAVTRRVPRTTGVLRAALASLLTPVRPEEAAAGLSGVVDEALPAPGVTLAGGAAVVDLDPALVDAAPGGSTSTGGALLREALARTAFQFATVDTVELRLGGSCEAFWAWQQLGGCPLVERAGG